MPGIAILAKFINETAPFAWRTDNAHGATTTLKSRRFEANRLVGLRVIDRVLIALRRTGL
jgi:hypothetical protein